MYLPFAIAYSDDGENEVIIDAQGALALFIGGVDILWFSVPCSTKTILGSSGTDFNMI